MQALKRKGVYIAFELDGAAIARAQAEAGAIKNRFVFPKVIFRIRAHTRRSHIGGIDGAPSIWGLVISARRRARGFSFTHDGPLKCAWMREAGRAPRMS
jgi:16S rRNA C1402 N4-methylase RsmH